MVDADSEGSEILADNEVNYQAKFGDEPPGQIARSPDPSKKTKIGQDRPRSVG